jgi:hypothetical protein
VAVEDAAAVVEDAALMLIVVFIVVLALTALSLVVIIDMTGKAPRFRPLNMIALFGCWELSIAAFIIATGNGISGAIGPGMLGTAMVAARWVVPRVQRRMNR